jgi:hypothetical protein
MPIQLQVHIFFTILPRHTAPVWWRVVVIGKLPSAFTPSQEAQGTYGKCAPLNHSRHDTSQYNNDLQKRASQWNYQRAQKSAHLRKGTSWCSNHYSNDIHNSDASNTTQHNAHTTRREGSNHTSATRSLTTDNNQVYYEWRHVTHPTLTA